MRAESTSSYVNSSLILLGASLSSGFISAQVLFDKVLQVQLYCNYILQIQFLDIERDDNTK